MIRAIIDFDDDGAIAFLPDTTPTDTSPTRRGGTRCAAGNYAHVFPTEDSHFHLGYVRRRTIGRASTRTTRTTHRSASFSRGDDCEPIDPLTEPRSDINTALPVERLPARPLSTRSDSGYKPQPFTLEQVRILQAPVRVCYRMPPDGTVGRGRAGRPVRSPRPRLLLGQPRYRVVGSVRLDGRHGRRLVHGRRTQVSGASTTSTSDELRFLRCLRSDDLRHRSRRTDQKNEAGAIPSRSCPTFSHVRSYCNVTWVRTMLRSRK